MESAPVSRSFSSVEHLEEVASGLGWTTEYRQLKPGSFSSNVTELEGDSWFILREQYNHTVEVEAPTPPGMCILAVVENAPFVINSQTVGLDHILLLNDGADFRATAPGEIVVTQIGIAAEEFEGIVEDLAPGLPVPRQGHAVISTPPGRLANVKRALSNELIPNSSPKATRDEALSSILSDIVSTAADHRSYSIDRGLHGAAGRRALDRAREYIEANLDRTIRIASICRHVGVTQRSLNRIFARELGMSPQEYVKVRRLNGAHRRLLDATPEQNLRVTDVALSFGFAHMGRFATEYRRYFGELPRHTLSHHLQ